MVISLTRDLSRGRVPGNEPQALHRGVPGTRQEGIVCLEGQAQERPPLLSGSSGQGVALLPVLVGEGAPSALRQLLPSGEPGGHGGEGLLSACWGAVVQRGTGRRGLQSVTAC